MVLAATSTTAVACVVQPPLGLAIGLLARCWSAAEGASAAATAKGARAVPEAELAAAAALLQFLLSLQSTALMVPSAVAVIQVMVESRGTRWVTFGSLEDVVLALATALPALVPPLSTRRRPAAAGARAGWRTASDCLPISAAGDARDSHAAVLSAMAYGVAAATLAVAAAPGRVHLAQHAAAIASCGPVLAKLILLHRGKDGGKSA